jgi:hypothetical protein
MTATLNFPNAPNQPSTRAYLNAEIRSLHFKLACSSSFDIVDKIIVVKDEVLVVLRLETLVVINVNTFDGNSNRERHSQPHLGVATGIMSAPLEQLRSSQSYDNQLSTLLQALSPAEKHFPVQRTIYNIRASTHNHPISSRR